MAIRAGFLIACLLLASAAAAETIYKYRAADGRTTYSNRLIPGAELIETFDYRFAAPAAAAPAEAKAGAAADARMKAHLSALEKAWSEVQDATKALADAEARLSAGVGPLSGEGTALAGPSAPAPPAVGGPQGSAAPVTGGPSSAASPAVGGPMGTRRGGGRNPEYAQRMAALEADVHAARVRLDTALRDYHQLR